MNIIADVPIVRLRRDRDRSLRRRHPWVYSGAIAAIAGEPSSGDIVRVVDHTGAFLGWAYFNERSKIRARILDWDPNASIDHSWWRRRIEASIARRRELPSLRGTDAFRLVHSEADGLPGLVVDRYGQWLVVQALTAGVEKAKAVIVEVLADAMAPRGIYERSDQDARALEGLRLSAGRVAGEEPPDRLEVDEHGHRFFVDVKSGQKTGFYIDQRDNRARVAEYVEGKDVLDLFSYTGAFSVYALRAGASRVTLVESSAPALALCQENLLANGADPASFQLVQGNAFETVRMLRDEGLQFGVVIVDPPKLAQTRAHLDKAERAYKDVNLMSMGLLEPGGILATFSCSGAVSIEHFSKIVAWASLDAGRPVQIIHRLSQGADHPIVPSFPESEYLTGLICRVL
jgi:23S rRNA (cytosine1962-C5)-methyltransferase